jgi:signal transduction histidine kinase
MILTRCSPFSGIFDKTEVKAISLKKGKSYRRILIRFVCHIYSMSRAETRSYLLIFIISGFLYPSSLDAQIPDSLDRAINSILTDAAGSRRAEKTSSIDTLAVTRFLAEAEKYQRINSDSSFLYTGKALRLALKSGSLRLLSLSLQAMGDYYLSHEMYRESMSYFLKCLAIEEKRGGVKRTADLYDELGSVYYYLEVFDKSLDYNQKALDIYRSYNDTSGTARALSHLGTLYSSREFCEDRSKAEKLVDFQTAVDYYNQAIKYSSLAGNHGAIAKDYQNIAAVYNKLEKPQIALTYVKRALDYYRQTGDAEGILGTLFTLGKTYYRLGDYKKSVEAFRESERMAVERNLTGGIQYLYEALAMPYYAMGDYKAAYDTYIRYMTIRDSVYNAEKSKQIIELETQYQSEIRQKEILRLKAEEKRRNALLYSLVAVILLLGFSIYYYVRLVRKNRVIAGQKLQLKEEKIRELEQERLYLAARSVMEGEEAERTRLASDLHNGLGGLLSGIKINLSSMKENAVITHENISAFNHALSLLDTSISELRRIAHNLMPETLNHYGLKTALEDFCTQVAPAGKPEISLQFFGDDIRYTKELELTMYRVIQELVNNALKHSEATMINIQVFSEPGRLSAQVTDNGKGFDAAACDKERKGKGIENIRDRVTALNGKLDIWSQPGQGTEISVEIEIH